MHGNRVWVNPSIRRIQAEARINSLESEAAILRDRIARREMIDRTNRAYDICLEAMTTGSKLGEDTPEVQPEKVQSTMLAFEARNMVKSRLRRKELATKKTLSRTTANNDIKKTVRSSSRLVEIKEKSTTDEKQPSQNFPDGSGGMVSDLETIMEDPEEDDAMEKTTGMKQEPGADDEEPDFEKMWDEANGVV